VRRSEGRFPVGDGRTTVFLSFHRTAEAPAFAAFADLVGAQAASAPGFVRWSRSVLTSPVLEWALAVTFRDESSAQEWLDHAGDLLTGHEFLRADMELFVEGSPPTPGVLLVREAVEPGREAGFLESTEHLAELERARPGHEGSSVFPPYDDQHSWSSVIRFRTERQLDAWLASPELGRALPERQAHLSEESQVMTATSFGSTVRVADGETAVTPGWKTALTILLVLYPAVMLLNRFLGPWLNRIAPQPWLSVFVNLAISIVLLTWVLMPLASRLLRRWLDPVDGAGRGRSLLGAVAVCVGYVVLFVIFSTVGFLQFWTH
jgi:antibiotic biosynthesis monooxygenase (ABM) superfamily enzyme